jgi:hypothetical protein
MSRFRLHYIGRRQTTIVVSLTCILLSFVLLLCSRRLDGFAEWYALKVFPLFPNTVGRLFSPLPFSIFEFEIYLIILLLLFWLILAVPVIFGKSLPRKQFFASSARFGLLLLSCLFLIFTLTGSMNYSRATFADTAGIMVREYSDEELQQLSLTLIEELAFLEEKIFVDEEGKVSFEELDLNQEVIDAMKGLGEGYTPLAGYYPRPKPILFSRGLSYLGITGIFSPFTLEANYNQDVADYLIPYTMAHELAHLKGFMREEDAGFIAFLACHNSNSFELQYSGLLNGLSYTLRALRDTVSPSEYEFIYSQIPDQARAELQKSRLYWSKHTAAVTTFAKAANDHYLIVNSQSEGTKSYGRMVDLLLALYAHENEGTVLL